MRAIREQRGQTGGEYAGVLLLIALIVPLAALGPGEKIAASTAEAVRCIAAGGNCPASTPPRLGHRAGPPIGDGEELDVLPYPGSASIATTVGASTDNIGVTATVTHSNRRGPEVVDARGCVTIALSVTVDGRVTGSIGGSTPQLGGTLEVFTGESSTYLVNVSPEQLDAMEDGGEAPNPFDPRSIAIGGGIVLTEETYTGLGMTAQYGVLVGSSGRREGDRVASGVVRVSEGVVRVYVGDEHFVEQAASMTLGMPEYGLQLGGTREHAEGELRQVDIDISTPAGWDAYQHFIATGELPAADADGVVAAADVDQHRYAERDEIGPVAGPFRVLVLAGDGAGVYSDATYADGSTSYTQTSRHNDVTMLAEHRTDADGATTATYGLLLHDVAEHALLEYEVFRGEADGEAREGTVDARIDYTAEDLDQIQQQVYETIAFANRDVPGSVLAGASPEEVAAYFEQLPDDAPLGDLRLGNTVDPAQLVALEAIARADHPEDVLLAIGNAGAGNPEDVLRFLNMVAGELAFARDAETGETGTPGSLVRLDGSECR